MINSAAMNKSDSKQAQPAPAGQQRGLWWALTRPHPSITDVEMRRQSRLLAGIALTMVAMITLASAMLVARDGLTQTVYMTWASIALTLCWYFLNRRGYYRVSSIAFMAQSFALIFGNALFAGSLEWLFFGTMNMLLAALLLPGQGAVIVFILSVVAQFALMAFKPLSTTMTNFGSTIIFLVTAPLILVFMYHRTRLEQERQEELRQANTRLRDSEIGLQASLEEVRNLNENLEQLVDVRTRDLKVAKDEAEAARERAEKADRIKSQFLASMSHELRTPLNSILTFTQLLGMGTFGPVNAEQKDYLEKSLSSGRHLLALINDVLDVTKIQSGMMKLFVEDDLDMTAEAREIAVTAEKMLIDKPVKLITDIDSVLPPLICDKRRIRQVLLNLVSNAIKFTEKGSITLSVKAQTDSILIAVLDTGPGIKPEDQEVIFNPFIQTEAGIQHGGGTGLGLPISKSLVEAHGGKLWVESKPGQGAAFFVSLPLRPALALGEQEV